MFTSQATQAMAAQSTGQASMVEPQDVSKELTEAADAGDDGMGTADNSLHKNTCDNKVAVASSESTPDPKRKNQELSVTPPPTKKAKTKAVDHQENKSLTKTAEYHQVCKDLQKTQPALSETEMKSIVEGKITVRYGPQSFDTKMFRKALKAAKAELEEETLANSSEQYPDIIFSELAKVLWATNSIGNSQVDDQEEKGRVWQLIKDTVNGQEEQAGRAGSPAGLVMPPKLFEEKVDKVCQQHRGGVEFTKAAMFALQVVVEKLVQTEARCMQTEAGKRNRKIVLPKDFDSLSMVTCQSLQLAVHNKPLGPCPGIPTIPSTPAGLPATPATSACPVTCLPGTPTGPATRLPGTPMPVPGTLMPEAHHCRAALPATPLPASAGPVAPTAGTRNPIGCEGKKALRFFDKKLRFDREACVRFRQFWDAHIERMSGWCLKLAGTAGRATVEIDDILLAMRQEAMHRMGYPSLLQVSPATLTDAATHALAAQPEASTGSLPEVGLVYDPHFAQLVVTASEDIKKTKELRPSAPKRWERRTAPFGPVGILARTSKGKAQIIGEVMMSTCNRGSIAKAENGDEFVVQERVQVPGGEPKWIPLTFAQHRCDQAYLEGLHHKAGYSKGFKVITLTKAVAYPQAGPYPSNGGQTWRYLTQ